MKQIFIILFFFSFIGCSVSESQQASSYDTPKKCEKIDIYFDCMLNRFTESQRRLVEINYDPELSRDIGKEIGKECLKEQGSNPSEGDDLDSMKLSSDITNYCKYQVTDYLGEYDLYVQMMYCSKTEMKRHVGCL